MCNIITKVCRANKLDLYKTLACKALPNFDHISFTNLSKLIVVMVTSW